MRIRTLALLTSFAAFGCPSDDDDGTTDQTTTGPTTTSPTTTDGSESSTSPTTTSPTTTDGSESSTSPTTTGTESGSESESGTSPDTGSSGSESGGPSPECVNYCDLFQTNCDGGVGGSMSYADDDACLAACAGFSEMGLMCRTGHLDGSATGMDPTMVKGYYDTHCPHGDSSGGGVCMD